jgi:hypothetical protein
MRLPLSFLAWLFLAPALCPAQDTNQPPACILIYGGANLSFVNSAYVYSSEARAGYQAGVAYRTTENFYFQGGVQFIHADPNMSYILSDDVPMNYIQFPILAGLNVSKSPDLRHTLHVHLGGSFTTLLSVGDNDLGLTINDLRKTGFTVKTGIGTDQGIFFADLNYNLLLTHLYDVPGYNNKARLGSWELNAGIKLNLN